MFYAVWYCFCAKNDGFNREFDPKKKVNFCIQIDEFCVETDGFCIENDDLNANGKVLRLSVSTPGNMYT